MLSSEYVKRASEYLVKMEKDKETILEQAEYLLGYKPKFRDAVILMANLHFLRANSSLFKITSNMGCGFIFDDRTYCNIVRTWSSRCDCRNQKGWEPVVFIHDLLNKPFLDGKLQHKISLKNPEMLPDDQFTVIMCREFFSHTGHVVYGNGPGGDGFGVPEYAFGWGTPHSDLKCVRDDNGHPVYVSIYY